MKYLAANKIKIGDRIQFKHQIYVPHAPHEFPKTKYEWLTINVDIIERDESHDDCFNFIEKSTGYIFQVYELQKVRVVNN